MATNGKKKPVQRQFVNASGKPVSKTGSAPAKKPAAKKPAANKPAAKTSAASTAKKTAAKKPAAANTQTAYISAEHQQKANGLRIGAVVLWVLAIVFEVLTILVINKTLYIPDNFKMFAIIAGIVLDLVCVIVGSQLWKKANRYDPASEKNKLKFFLWNQMGVIAAVLAFFPLVILLLKEDDLDPKMKKILSIIAAVALLLSVGTSIDYSPVSAEDLAQAQSDAYELSADGSTCYWTTFGKCYHFNPDCHTIINSNPVYTGTVDEAFVANRSKPCSYCAVEGAEELFSDERTTSMTDVSGSDLLASGADLLAPVSGSDLADAA